MKLGEPMNPAEAFLLFCMQQKVLLFGEFKTKAGRRSPYFFNAGLFNDGYSLGLLAEYYADRIVASEVQFDVLFGPAYKGISLASTVAVALARKGHNVPYAYNRKEAKDHGEGGTCVGAPLVGRVLIIDDVVSAGTSVRESVELIHAAGATLAGVVISLDRQERGQGELSATQEIEETYHIPAISIATLTDLVGFLKHSDGYDAELARIEAYRDQYGAK